MQTNASLIYNVTGQVVDFVPPFEDVMANGAPAAATYSVWGGTQSNDESAKFSGTATLDSVSTTVNAASGYSQTNKRRVFLASIAGIVVGRNYLLTNTLGQRVVVSPIEIQATYVVLGYDLAYDFASSSTFIGLRHYFTVDATFIQDLSNINIYGQLPRLGMQHVSSGGRVEAPPYRVRWSFTAGGVSFQRWTYFDVVRQQSSHSVMPRDLQAWFPDMVMEEWESQKGELFRRQIEAAWSMVQNDIRMAGYDPDAIRDGALLDQVVRCAALMVISDAGVSPTGRNPDQWAAERRNDYKLTFQRAIGSGLAVWLDTGNSGAITPDPPKQPWFRR